LVARIRGRLPLAALAVVLVLGFASAGLAQSKSLTQKATEAAEIIAVAGGEPPNDVAKDGKTLAIQVFTRFNSSSDCTPADEPTPCVLTSSTDTLLAINHVFANLSLPGGSMVASVNMSLGSGNFSGNCDTDSHKPPIGRAYHGGLYVCGAHWIAWCE
jgi:hypothetical protein